MRYLIGGLMFSLAAFGAAADDFDRIKESGKIVVATEAAFKPFEYVENGQIVGFGADLLKEVVSDMGVEVEQLDLPFQGILAGLAAGQYDLVATSVAINPERAATYAFTRPIASIENVVVTAADNTAVDGVEDLNGLVVGTQLGSSTEAVAREIDAELKTGGGAGFTDLRLFQTFPDTAFALRSGQVDAIIIGNTTAGEFMAASPDTFRIAATWGDPVYISWVVRPGNPKLLASVNGTIARLADSGQLAEMQQKWVGTTMAVPAEGYLPEGAVQ
jgi:polar amino acid transport system substrate-binding protein